MWKLACAPPPLLQPRENTRVKQFFIFHWLNIENAIGRVTFYSYP